MKKILFFKMQRKTKGLNLANLTNELKINGNVVGMERCDNIRVLSLNFCLKIR